MSEELVKRVDDLENIVSDHDLELNRARERSAADLARFEGVRLAIDNQRDEFHRDLEASEGRMCERINRVDTNITRLGNGQAVILEAIGKMGPAPSASPGHDPAPVSDPNVSAWSMLPLGWKVAITGGLAVGAAIAAFVLALLRGGWL